MHFLILLTFYLVLSEVLLLLLFGFIVVFFSLESFLFPDWAVFSAGAFEFLVSPTQLGFAVWNVLTIMVMIIFFIIHSPRKDLQFP